MTVMGLREARADFSAVLKRVARGEAITVTRHGVAMAHLMPPKGAAAAKKAGAQKTGRTSAKKTRGKTKKKPSRGRRR